METTKTRPAKTYAGRFSKATTETTLWSVALRFTVRVSVHANIEREFMEYGDLYVLDDKKTYDFITYTYAEDLGEALVAGLEVIRDNVKYQDYNVIGINGGMVVDQ